MVQETQELYSGVVSLGASFTAQKVVVHVWKDRSSVNDESPKGSCHTLGLSLCDACQVCDIATNETYSQLSWSSMDKLELVQLCGT